MSDPDLDILHEVRDAMARVIGRDRADAEVLILRERWGGTRPYIQKHPPAHQNAPESTITSSKAAP